MCSLCGLFYSTYLNRAYEAVGGDVYDERPFRLWRSTEMDRGRNFYEEFLTEYHERMDAGRGWFD